MIKKAFDDGCLGIKLFAEEVSDERILLRNLRDISPLSPSDTEILANNIHFKEQDTKMFPASGYRVGWKRAPGMSYVVIVFCPIQGEYTEAGM